MSDADVADLATLEHVDRAPVGQARYRELDELRQRVLQVERLGEHDARLGEEREGFLALAVLGEIEEGGDRGDDLAAGLAHRFCAERDDAAGAVGADDLDLAVRRSTSPASARCTSSAWGPAIERSEAPWPSISCAR